MCGVRGPDEMVIGPVGRPALEVIGDCVIRPISRSPPLLHLDLSSGLICRNSSVSPGLRRNGQDA